MPNSATIKVGAPGAKQASSEIDQLRNKFDQLQKAGAKGFALGVGIGIAQTAFNSLGSVVGDATQFLGDSVTAFRNEEASAARLTQSLKENVQGWNGDMAAMDAAVKSGQQLGFTNTDVQDSLALLVGATHDASKAVSMLAVAQDYARYKNIGLLQAATDLTKVEGGSTRALKALGINLHTGATEAERMAAVMAVVGGQAQAFAGTDLGKVTAASEKVNEAQEKLGAALSKIGVVVLPVLADALTQGVDDLERFGKGISDDAKVAGDWLSQLLTMGTAAVPAAKSTDYLGASAHSATGKLNQLTPALKDAAVAADTAAPRFRNIGKELQYAATQAGNMDSEISGLTDTIFGEQKLLGDASQAWADLNDAIAKGPGGHAIQDMEKYNGTIADLTAKALEAEGALAKARGPQAFADWLVTLKARLDLTNPAIALMYQNLLNTASAAGKLPSYLTGQIGARTVAGAHKAGGGPVTAGVPYTVGEVGPELFVPNTSGTIVPNNKIGSGGGTTYNFNLTVQGDLRARDPNEVLTTLRRMQAIAT